MKPVAPVTRMRWRAGRPVANDAASGPVNRPARKDASQFRTPNKTTAKAETAATTLHANRRIVKRPVDVRALALESAVNEEPP